MDPVRGRPWVADLVVGLVLAATGVPPYLDRPAVAAAQAAMSAAVVVRRRFAFSAATAVAALFLVEALLTGPDRAPEDQVSLIAVPLLAYTVAASRRRPVAVAGLLVLLTGVFLETRYNGGGGDYLFNLGFVLVGWLPGALMYGRRLELHRLEDTAQRLARERDEQAEAVAAAERARLAREVHDIVAHSVGVMTVQAAAADQVLDDSPEAAHRALARVQDVGQQTVAELHRLLGLLRAEDPPGTAPQPGLAQVPDLVAAAGLPVAVEVLGTPRPLPPALELSAYRIVQEAVTNAGKHAPGARVEVRLRYEPDALVVEVGDDGGRGAGNPGPGGHGLIGMRERVAMFGGRLSAGPRPGGGFAVRAHLPFDGPASAAAPVAPAEPAPAVRQEAR